MFLANVLVEDYWDRWNQERLWGTWTSCPNRALPWRRKVHGYPRWSRSCHQRQKGNIFSLDPDLWSEVSSYDHLCRDLGESLSRRPTKPLSLASTMNQWLEASATWWSRGSAITLSSLISKFTLFKKSASNQNFNFKVLLLLHKTLFCRGVLWFDLWSCIKNKNLNYTLENDLRNKSPFVFLFWSLSLLFFLCCISYCISLVFDFNNKVTPVWYTIWVYKSGSDQAQVLLVCDLRWLHLNHTDNTYITKVLLNNGLIHLKT